MSSKEPVGKTKKTFANNGRRKKMNKNSFEQNISDDEIKQIKQSIASFKVRLKILQLVLIK